LRRDWKRKKKGREKLSGHFALKLSKRVAVQNGHRGHRTPVNYRANRRGKTGCSKNFGNALLRKRIKRDKKGEADRDT